MMTQTANSYVAHNYAHALYGLCVQDHTEAETIAQLAEIYAAMRDAPGYMKMLSSPAIPKSERIEALDRAFAGSCSERAIGFLKVLIAHGHIASLGECIDAMRALQDDAQGVLTAEVVSAVPLTDAQANALIQKLEARTGRKIRLNRRIDPNLIGGAAVYVNGRVFDGTLRSRLNELKDVMKQ